MNEVAAFLHIDSSLVSRFESGARRPTKEQIIKYEELFNLKQNELLKEWVADEVVSNLKHYPFVMDVMSLVNEAIAGYQQLLNKKENRCCQKPDETTGRHK